MTDVPPIWILLTTFQRTECAIKTVRAVKQNLLWPNIGFVVTDDTSDGDHLDRIMEEIGGTYAVHRYDNAAHKGVGHNMNYGLRKIWEFGAELTMILEDDWELVNPFDPTPHVRLLMNHSDIGMIRLGYLSVGLAGELISREDHLWMQLQRNGNQYVYAGHASLRHLRFHQRVGMFTEGLRPGANELDFGGRYNKIPNPPAIVWDMDYGRIGPFHHIGSESLADVEPGTNNV